MQQEQIQILLRRLCQLGRPRNKSTVFWFVESLSLDCSAPRPLLFLTGPSIRSEGIATSQSHFVAPERVDPEAGQCGLRILFRNVVPIGKDDNISTAVFPTGLSLRFIGNATRPL